MIAPRWLRSSWILRLLCVASLAAVSALASPARAIGPIQSVRTFAIWPVGDSITVGATGFSRALGNATRTPGGYRAVLDALLLSVGIKHRFIGTCTTNASPTQVIRGQEHHDGHGGYRIDEVLDDLAGVAGGSTDGSGHWLTGVSGVRGPLYPDIVIIHLGTNDIVQDYDPGRTFPTGTGRADYANPAQRSQFVEDMLLRLQKLVETIYHYRPAVRIVLSDVIPIGRAIGDRVTGQYGRAVARLVGEEQERGRQIVFADVWRAFTVAVGGIPMIIPGLMSADTHHPTAAGYHVMAHVYLDAIEHMFGNRI